MLQLMAGAERLCHFFEWGRELMSYFQMGREMKKVGNHCSRCSTKLLEQSVTSDPESKNAFATISFGKIHIDTYR